jgi:hypothetical protein
VSARLCTGKQGQPLAVVTVNTLPQLEQGHVFRVLDVDAALGFEPRGREPTDEEQKGAKNPFGKPWPWRMDAPVGGAPGHARDAERRLSIP